MPVSGRREAEVSGRRPAGRHSHGSGLGRGYRVQGWPCARPPFAELAFAFKLIFGSKSAGDRRVHRETARSELRRLEFISNLPAGGGYSFPCIFIAPTDQHRLNKQPERRGYVFCHSCTSAATQEVPTVSVEQISH